MDLSTLRGKYTALSPVLTERSRRLWATTEARAIGYGGMAQVARATGIAASTIQRGLRALTSGEPLDGTRKAGGGFRDIERGGVVAVCDAVLAELKAGNAHHVNNAVRANVVNVVAQLRAAKPVLAELVAEGKLRIVGAVYSIDTGKVEWLPDAGIR